MVNSVNNNESFIPFFIGSKTSKVATTAIAQNLNEPSTKNPNKVENNETYNDGSLEQQQTTLNPSEDLKKLQHIFNAHKQCVQQLSKEHHQQKVLEKQSQTTSALMIDLCFQRCLKALAELEKELSVLIEKKESLTEIEYNTILNHVNTAMATDNALIDLLTYKTPMAKIIKDKTFDCLNHPLAKSALSALTFGTQLFFTTQIFNHPPTTQNLIAAAPASILAYAGLTGISKIYNNYVRSPARNESFSNAMIYTIEQISSSAVNLLELAFPEKEDQEKLKNQYSTLANNNQLTLGELHQQIDGLLAKVKNQINHQISDKESKENIHQVFYQIEGLIKSLDVIAGVRNQIRRINFNQIDDPSSTLQIPGEHPHTPLIKELTQAALWSPKTTIAALRSEEKDWPIKLKQSGQIYNSIKTLTQLHDAFTQNLKKAQETIEFVKNCQQDKANDLPSSDFEVDASDSEEDSEKIVNKTPPPSVSHSDESQKVNEAIEQMEKTVGQLRIKTNTKNYFTSEKHKWPDINEIEKSIAAFAKANAELEELIINAKCMKANSLLEVCFAAGFSKDIQNIVVQWKKNINISITPWELKAPFDELIKSIYPLCQKEIQKDFKAHQPLIDSLWNEKGLKKLLYNTPDSKTLSLASLTPECRKKHYQSWMQLKSNAAKATTFTELIACKQGINKTVATVNALKRLLTHKPSYHIKNFTVDCLNKPITKSVIAALSSVAGVYFGISQTTEPQALLQCFDYNYSNAPIIMGKEDYINNPMFLKTQADVPSTLPITLASGICLPIITYAGITAASSLYNKYWRTVDCNASFSNAMIDTIKQISSSIKETLELKYRTTRHEHTQLEKQCLELVSKKKLTLEQLSVSVATLLLEIRSSIVTSDPSKEKIHQICYKIEGLLEGLNDLSLSHNQMRISALNKISGDLRSFKLFSKDPSVETIFDKLIQSVSWSPNTTIAAIESDEKDWPEKEAWIKKIYDSFNSSARIHRTFEEILENYPNNFPNAAKLFALEEEALVALQRNYSVNIVDLAGLKTYQDETQKRNKSLELASSATSQLKAEYETFDINLQKIDSWVASHKSQGIQGKIQELEKVVQEIRQKYLPENSSPITSITTALDALEMVKKDNEQLPIILKECEENFEHTKTLSDQLLSNIQKFVEQLHDYRDKTSEIENYYRINLSPVHQLIQKDKDRMLSLQTKIKNLTDLNLSNFKQYKEMLYNEIKSIRAQLKDAPNISKAYAEHKNFLIQCKKTEDRIEFLKSLTPPQFLAAAQLEEEMNSLKNPSGLSFGFLRFLLGSLPATANTFFEGMSLNPLTPLKNPTIALRKLYSPIESMIWGILISGEHTAKLRGLLAASYRRTPSMSLPAQLSVNRYFIPSMFNVVLPDSLNPPKKVGKYEQALRTEFLKDTQANIDTCKSKLEACQKNLNDELAKYIHPGWYNIINDYITKQIDELYFNSSYYYVPRLSFIKHPYWISMPFGILRPEKFKFLWRPLYTSQYSVDSLNYYRLEHYKTEMNRMTEGIIKNLNDITYLPTIDQHYTDLITAINKAKALADSLEAKHHPLAAESLQAVCREVKQNLFDNHKQVYDLQRMKLLAVTLTTARDTVNNTILLYKFLENRPNTIFDRIQALPEDLNSSAAQTARMLIIKDIREVIRTFIADINKGRETLKALDEKALVDPVWREALSQELKNSLTEIAQCMKGLKILATKDAPQSVIPPEKLKKEQLLTYYRAIEKIASKTINGKKNEASHFLALEQIPIIEKLDKCNDQLQKTIKDARKFLGQYSDLNASKNTEIRAQGIKSLQHILDYTQSMSDIMIRRMGCLLEAKECIAFLENSQQAIEKAIKNIKENKSVELGTWGQMKALEFENPEIPLSPNYGSAQADVNISKHMTLRDKILTGGDPISEQRTKLALSAAKQAIAIGNQYDLVRKEDTNAIIAGWIAVGERLGCEEDLKSLSLSEIEERVNNKLLNPQIRKKGSVFAQSLCETAAIATAEYLIAKNSTKNIIIASVAKVAGDIGCKLPARKAWDESFTKLSPLDSSSNGDYSNNDSDDSNDDESIDSRDENAPVGKNKNSIHSNTSNDSGDSDDDSDSSDNKKAKPSNLNNSSQKKQDHENSIKGAKAAGKAIYTVMCNIIDKDSTIDPKDKPMDALIASGMGAAYYSFPENPTTPSEAGKLAGKATIATLSTLKQKNIKNSDIKKIAGIAAGFAAAAHAISINHNVISITTAAAKAAASTAQTLSEGTKENDRESIIEISAIAAGIAGALYESFLGENTDISRASRNAAVTVMRVISNLPLTNNSIPDPAVITVFDFVHTAAKTEALTSNDKDRINNAAIEAAIKAVAPIKYNNTPSIRSIQGNLNAIEDNLNKYNNFITPLIDQCQLHMDYEARLQKWRIEFEKWDENHEGQLAAPLPPRTNKPYNSSVHELMLELQKEIKNAKKRIEAIKFGLITSTHTIIVDNLKSSEQLMRFTRQCMRQCNYINDKIDGLVKKINNKSKKIIVKPIPLPEKFSWPLST